MSKIQQQSGPRRKQQPCSASSGLNDALCAYSFFRGRHVWKDRTKAKKKGLSHGLAKRIKDRSASGEKRKMVKHFIRKARKAGWRGSFIQAVLNPGQNEQGHPATTKNTP